MSIRGIVTWVRDNLSKLEVITNRIYRCYEFEEKARARQSFSARRNINRDARLA